MIRPPNVAAIYQSPQQYETEIIGYVSSEDIQDQIVLKEMEGKNMYIVRQRLYPGDEFKFPYRNLVLCNYGGFVLAWTWYE